MKKLFVCLFVVSAMMIGTFMQIAAAEDISVQVNGKAVEFPDAKPFIDGNGRVMVPLRPIADAMGMNVEWNEEKREAVFSKDYDEENYSRLYDSVYGFLRYEEIAFSIGSKTAVYYEGWAMLYEWRDEDTDDVITKEESRDIIMDTEAIIAAGRVYAPVRYLAEAVGYTVSWDDAGRTVIITSSDYEHTAEPPVTEPSTKPVLSDKDLDKLGFFSITYLSLDPDKASYMDIYYDKKYEGLKVSNITITSAEMNGDVVSCELVPERKFRYASSMEALASFEIGLPAGATSYKGNRTYSFVFTVEIEYADGSKILINDNKLLYLKT